MKAITSLTALVLGASLAGARKHERAVARA